MEARMIRLESRDGRWLEMTVEGGRAFARIGDAEAASEPFPFNFENLVYVERGMGYQAWGGGSHFAFRQEGGEVVTEFQRQDDRNPAILRLSREDLHAQIDALDAFATLDPRASVL